jgi:predicted DNA repair protein MutK
MAGTSLLALVDDIATILDDVAILTKLAAKRSAAVADDVAVLTKLATRKTAGVLGDDLALNAEQVSGVRAERELPVVWAVAKGSLVNKAILVPTALGISAVAPWAVTPLLMVGGAFLCYEGFEKVAHKLLHGGHEDAARRAELAKALVDPHADLAAVERDKIKGAVRTDFVLSAEILVIALGAVAAAPFVTRVGVMVAIALVMTVGVYGFVAAIVKLDDAGLYLHARPGISAFARLQRGLGAGILGAAPWLMRALGVAGTAAMFLVGGGILSHGIPPVHHWTEGLVRGGGLAATLGPALANAAVGVVAGGLLVGVQALARRLRRGTSGAGATPAH